MATVGLCGLRASRRGAQGQAGPEFPASREQGQEMHIRYGKGVCAHMCVLVGWNAPSTLVGAGTGGEIMQNWGMGNALKGSLRFPSLFLLLKGDFEVLSL